MTRDEQQDIDRARKWWIGVMGYVDDGMTPKIQALADEFAKVRLAELEELAREAGILVESVYEKPAERIRALIVKSREIDALEAIGRSAALAPDEGKALDLVEREHEVTRSKWPALGPRLAFDAQRWCNNPRPAREQSVSPLVPLPESAAQSVPPPPPARPEAWNDDDGECGSGVA